MLNIENKIIKIIISEKGAELQKFFNKETGLDYLWDGNPDYWGKHSPILFPIVGALQDNTYYFNSKAYHLSRHGFALDKVFEITNHTNDLAEFTLKSNETTLAAFPFPFILKITYKIVGPQLTVEYQVENPVETPLYFSIGGHPAFKVPLLDKNNYDDYYLLFEKRETAGKWMIKNNLLEMHATPFFENDNRLWLHHDLFYQDALVFKNLESRKVSLLNDRNNHGIHFNYEGFPYLGIWSARDADFVCIEPWCGIADSIGHDQQLATKEGIIKLEGKSQFVRKWKAVLF
jgi:galactose mutarotase-like enzyme